MRHHFSEVHVITTPGSKDGVIARQYNCVVYETNVFTASSAHFNKWAALEQGLDAMGREGWICHLDADVIWPAEVEWPDSLTPGMLCSPLRRMLSINPEADHSWKSYVGNEEMWNLLPIHRNVNEHAGYTQVYHASDPRLGKPPWHEVDYKHAGAADSWFQRKWPSGLKIRPNWECLHIGEAGQNWMGRATNYLDGSSPPGQAEKLAAVNEMWRVRNDRRRRGLDPFEGERLK
jgi:hypothetical protein